jgi:VanZ family protein
VKTAWQHFLSNQLPALLWAGVIFVASSIPASRLPPIAFKLNDKLIHASIYFVFGLLVYRALLPRQEGARGFRWKRLLLAVGAVILYGISDEFHQKFVPGRTEDILDAAADSAGGILAAVAVYISAFRKGIKTPEEA